MRLRKQYRKQVPIVKTKKQQKENTKTAAVDSVTMSKIYLYSSIPRPPREIQIFYVFCHDCLRLRWEQFPAGNTTLNVEKQLGS